MIRYSEEIDRKTFTDSTMKGAYLKACKWYASNVLSKDELTGIHVEFEKRYDDTVPTVTIHLYASLVEDEVLNSHCQICKETHSSFYINDETNCNYCKVKAYQRRLENRIAVKRQYSREIINNPKS